MFEHLTTKFRRYYDNIEVSSDNPMFLTFELDTRNFADGEYQLTIYTDKNEVVGEEIIRIGNYKTANTQYKVEKKFTQYVRK